MLDKLFNKTRSVQDLLLVSMEERDWYICTTGRGIDIITNDEIVEISDSFLPDLSAGNYFSAFRAFINSAKAIVQRAQ